MDMQDFKHLGTYRVVGKGLNYHILESTKGNTRIILLDKYYIRGCSRRIDVKGDRRY